MSSKTPKFKVTNEKGKKTSLGKGVKDMKFGETRTFRISIEMPEEKPPKEKK